MIEIKCDELQKETIKKALANHYECPIEISLKVGCIGSTCMNCLEENIKWDIRGNEMTEQCKKCSMKDLCICIPSTDECHVRKQSFNKAIDEIVNRFKDWMLENVGLSQKDIQEIDEIAEQMKGE